MFFFTDHFRLAGRRPLLPIASEMTSSPKDLLDVGFADFHFWRGTVGATFASEPTAPSTRSVVRQAGG